MKEFNTPYDLNLNGLRKYTRTERNKQALTECFNLKPKESGLVPFDPISTPITDLDVEWPFPQFFLTNEYKLALTKDALYQVNADWSVTLLLDFSSDYRDNADWEYSIWHLADFFTYVVISNENIMIHFDTVTSAFKQLSPTVNIPQFSTICNFNGQAIIGNIKTTWYDTGVNSVVFSNIGSFDFLIDEGNVAGYRPMEGNGSITKIMKLGQGAIVYSSGGILALVPSDKFFAYKHLAGYGVPGRGMIGGNEDGHIFLDETGTLRRIKPDFSIEKLGYQEFFSPFLTEDVMISHDVAENEFFISVKDQSFLLTDQGLCKVLQSVTSVEIYSGGTVGVGTSTTDDNAQVVTDIFDMKVRGLKTIQTLEFGVDATSDCFVAVDWRAKKSDSFTRTSWTILNDQGVAVVPISGLDFRIAFKCDDYSDVNIDYINVRFKYTDKRSFRGRFNVT
jgi:hypothetical protein